MSHRVGEGSHIPHQPQKVGGNGEGMAREGLASAELTNAYVSSGIAENTDNVLRTFEMTKKELNFTERKGDPDTVTKLHIVGQKKIFGNPSWNSRIAPALLKAPGSMAYVNSRS